jgi:hypothetical protein
MRYLRHATGSIGGCDCLLFDDRFLLVVREYGDGSGSGRCLLVGALWGKMLVIEMGRIGLDGQSKEDEILKRDQ